MRCVMMRMCLTCPLRAWAQRRQQPAQQTSRCVWGGGGVFVRVCVSKYALRTCKQQSTLEESAIKQKSVAPFWELIRAYRVDFSLSNGAFSGSLRNALIDVY